ncbi:hypothetical protein N431DRAFT_450820 [Stipitochalara longipes BDJ]|nr:hypothetical protein N431DRAFT_450820 [Stipitochalara longipes BDJ]
MCIEYHHHYACNEKHTKFVGPEFKCPLSWVPGHGKVKVIQDTIHRPCDKCLSAGVYILTQPPYNMPFVYARAPAPVIYKQVPTLVVPAVAPALIVAAPAPPRAPTLPQQIPGPGSGGAPLAVPPGFIAEERTAWMASKGCFETVVHYKKDPAASATNTNSANKQGYNTIHGRDPGPLPPGWGAQPNPFPAPAKTGYNSTHGRDSGPPPPGMGGVAPVPAPLSQLLPATQPSVRFANPVAATTEANTANTDTSGNLTDFDRDIGIRH